MSKLLNINQLEHTSEYCVACSERGFASFTYEIYTGQDLMAKSMVVLRQLGVLVSMEPKTLPPSSPWAAVRLADGNFIVVRHRPSGNVLVTLQPKITKRAPCAVNPALLPGVPTEPTTAFEHGMDEAAKQFASVLGVSAPSDPVSE